MMALMSASPHITLFLLIKSYIATNSAVNIHFSPFCLAPRGNELDGLAEFSILKFYSWGIVLLII